MKREGTPSYSNAEHGPDDDLYVPLCSDWPWTGTLICDIPRHREYLHLPGDCPRLNQFPEWFTVEPERAYALASTGQDKMPKVTGEQLHDGLPIRLKPNEWLQMIIRPVNQ